MASNNTELCFTPATELADLIRRGELSPVELVDAVLDRIDRINPKINAYCCVLHDQARAAAKEAEAAVKRGDRLGPLHGIPIAIKDLTPTAGIRTTFGSKAFENFIPDRDAPFVERVKAAGAIILGKTNTPEFGWKGTTDNLLFGTTRNPWDPDKIAGGSSGGSAAAVAAGIAPLAEGSDGGGSIRIPSSACGVFGLKPTFGLIPVNIMLNCFAYSTPFITHGPIARTVADAALLLSVVVGPDESNPFSLPGPIEDYTQSLEGTIRGLKIAYSPDLGYFEIDPRVRRATDGAAKVFTDLGCAVEQVDPHFEKPETIESAFQTMWTVSFASNFQDLFPSSGELMTPEIRAIIMLGQQASAVEYKQTELTRAMVWEKIQAIFGRHDLLLTPTLAVPPFSVNIPGPTEINGKPVNQLLGWILTYPFNMTGHPAASIPCGFTEEGLPVGLQIVGKRFADGTILRASAAFERASPWAHKRPLIE